PSAHSTRGRRLRFEDPADLALFGVRGATRLLDALLAERTPLHFAPGPRVRSAAVTAAQGTMMGVQVEHRFFSTHCRSPRRYGTLLEHKSYPNHKHSQAST